MRKSRYDEAESGEFKLEACEVFFRYRVQKTMYHINLQVLKRAFSHLSELLNYTNIEFSLS